MNDNWNDKFFIALVVAFTLSLYSIPFLIYSYNIHDRDLSYIETMTHKEIKK